MRIYQLFHALIKKFVPMDESAEDELQLEAVNFYNQAKDELVFINKANLEITQVNADNVGVEGYIKKPLKTVTIKHKVIEFLDLWYMRYFNALLFIYLVPKIKSFINGEDGEDGEDEEEDEFKTFLDFKRFKKSMQ